MNANTGLAQFQRDFACLISSGSLGEGGSVWDAVLQQPGFAVYRNTHLKARIDTLVANYPSVERIVGTEWLRLTAKAFSQSTPPRDGGLISYGANFAEFLAELASVQELPYLADVARVDRFWTQAHTAADATALRASDLVPYEARALSRLTLKLHPSTHWAWFPHAPSYSLWRCTRLGQPWDENTDWKGEGLLIARPADTVVDARLTLGGCAFLDSCSAGETLSDAAAAAMAAEVDVALPALLAALIDLGAFVAIEGDADHRRPDFSFSNRISP